MFDSVIQFLPMNCGLRGKKFRAVYYSITFEMPFGLNVLGADSTRTKSLPSRQLKLSYRRLSFPPVACSITDNATFEKSRCVRFVLVFGFALDLASRFDLGMGEPCHELQTRNIQI